MAAEMNVITSTAARVAMSQRETASSRTHSSLLRRGVIRKALPHMAKSTASLLVWHLLLLNEFYTACPVPGVKGATGYPGRPGDAEAQA
jgi:hypothetical protein